MSFILELFLDFFVNGAADVAVDKEIPLRWRIVAGIGLTVILGLFLGISLYGAISSEKSGGRILFGSVAVFMGMGILWFWYKILTKRSSG